MEGPEENSAELTAHAEFTFRRATPEDLPVIYDLQDVSFRERVFAGQLMSRADFLSDGRALMEAGSEQAFLLERNGVVEGFAQYSRIEDPSGCDILVWGRWLYTLIYAGLTAAFDSLGFAYVKSAIRRDYLRVVKAYKVIRIRKVGQASVPYRTGGKFGDITIADFLYYEMTAEEYRERLPILTQMSHKVRFL